jgi:HAD superfamily hydrolase (TIGR01509 family)
MQPSCGAARAIARHGVEDCAVPDDAPFSSTRVPEAVLFDLDGTLVDSERENIESVALAVRRWGAELTDAERSFVIGHSWNEIHALIAHNHALPVTMPALIAAAVDEKRALLADSGYRALPAAVETVRRLAGRSKLAVVSGASRVEVLDALAGLGVLDAFQVVLGAEDYARGKPAPDSYALALSRLGAAPARSIAVEDATPGILAARAAGARVVAVRAGNFAGYDLSPADVVVETLAEVSDELLARLVS